jgi:hypothetical protein
MGNTSLFELFSAKENEDLLKKIKGSVKEKESEFAPVHKAAEDDPSDVKRQEKLDALSKAVAAKAPKNADEGGSKESRSDEKPAEESPEEVKRMETRGEISRSGTEIVKGTGRLKHFFLGGDAKEDPKAVKVVTAIGKAVAGAFKDMVG